jgi:hypothetical protein
MHHALAIAPKYQPAVVEERIRLVLPKATHDLLGIIDLADHNDQIIDFKTTGRKKQQAEADRSLQLSSYAVLWHTKTGRLPSRLLLDVQYRKEVPMSEVLTTTRDREDVAILVRNINVILAGINAGIFPPAPPGSWWCSAKFCGFHADCKYVRHK